ncbi:alpha/beta hydrolase [Leuconostoc falkenbergense]|uniref:alpha/beta hydrolase n=1 Tax=Leuconostoc falkenbergense TaxID=2766470 RepID=UPI0024ACDD23|nr:alpha/beta hydrolase [Leuconostoc falkenbergense]MDI6666720.1 alpha/beta hydrolase [Leuconostoc falkenbergense]
MRKKNILNTTIIILILAVIGGALLYMKQRSFPKTADRSNSVPTLYVHGWGAGARSTNSMIRYAENHDNAKKVLTATISPKGAVRFSGYWPKNTKKPLIQVISADNKYYNYKVTQKWFGNVLKKLQADYRINRYNTVSHSMGNLTTMYYQVTNGQNKHLPALQKQVNIAGHFDGIVGIDDKPNQNSLQANGEPRLQDSNYKYLDAHRQGYPSQQVDVLNIFGNLQDGSNSDGDVTVVSAKSLKYLLRDKYKLYQELEILGHKGQHSQLHENAQVDRAIGDFLWQQ